MSDGFGKSDERAGPISGTGVSEPGASAKEVTTVAAIFEARSPLAMFRKPYTTTSSVSFPFPPPTALAGLMAAVVGEGNGAGKEAFCAAFWKKLAGTRVALRILRSISWQRSALNFWNVKEPQKNPHIQVKHQFLSSVAYRVYVEGGVEEELAGRLRRGSFVYTPYLGVAYAIAELSWCGTFPAEPVSGAVRVDSVLPWKEGAALDVLASGGAFRETVPFRLDDERRLVQSVVVLYPVSPEHGLCLRHSSDAVRRCGSDVVAFFDSW